MTDYKAVREQAVREILRYVCDNRDLPPNAHEWDTAEVIKGCVDAGYLENIQTLKTLDGRVHLAAARPFVTEKGLAVLFTKEEQNTPSHPEDSSGEAIAAELTRMNDNMCQNHAEEKSEKKKDRRFQLFNTILGALLGAILTLLVEHWTAIVEFFSELFQ